MNLIKIKKIVDKGLITSITLKIMNALPKWFSPPEDIKNKSIEHRDMLFFGVFDKSKVIGFIALKVHNKYTVSIYNLGVLEEYHGQGIGHNLLITAENYCKESGYKFITVKTLDSSIQYEPYERTRRFYFKNGFYPLEVFPLIWNLENPCLFLAKYIGN